MGFQFCRPAPQTRWPSRAPGPRAHTVHSPRLRPTPRSQLCRPHHRRAGRISRQRSAMRPRSSRRQTPPWAPCNARSRLCLAVLAVGSSSERLELPERRERELESHRRFNSLGVSASARQHLSRSIHCICAHRVRMLQCCKCHCWGAHAGLTDTAICCIHFTSV